MSVARAAAFFEYLTERENVRLRKEAGDFFPWTEDEILRTYKFTNVQRHHDRTSRELRETFYTPNFYEDRGSILMNCATFRYFGTYEFAKHIGWCDWENFDDKWWEELKRTARSRLNNGERVFTGAYVITNQGISAPKEKVVVDYFLKDLQKAIPKILEIVDRTDSWEETSDYMKTVKGFGGSGFMTKEILLDTTYTGFWERRKETPDGRMSFPCDWEQWTPIGPGALRGASRCIDESADPKKPVKELQARNILMNLYEMQDQFFKHEFHLSPTDIQFGLCEFDKHERVRLGQGRPRSKYHVT